VGRVNGNESAFTSSAVPSNSVAREMSLQALNELIESLVPLMKSDYRGKNIPRFFAVLNNKCSINMSI
jgi:hypothetical protein